MTTISLFLAAMVLWQTTSTDARNTIVVVNGVPITENRLAFFRLVHGVGEATSPDARGKIVDQLIDDELMRQFLTDRRAEVDPKQLAAEIEALKERLRRENRDPDKTLKALGYTPAVLRRELSLPIAWQSHFSRVVTQQMVRDEFERHREEYDGTEVRASQIFKKVSPSETGPKAKEAGEKLTKIRGEIVSGKISFADAAKQYSEAPSASSGGDVGFFPFRGKMPGEITRVVFSLKVGDVSQPFRTTFGWHLYTVTARRPATLSLEDVRSAVLKRLSKDLWAQLVSQNRAKAKIEWREGSR